MIDAKVSPPSCGRRARRTLLVLSAVAGLGLAGCGQPTVAPNNLRLTTTLRTAISARNTDWLEKNAQLVAERHAAGEMSDEARAAFEAIIAEARSGDWESAERDVVRLQAAQAPTAEQVEAVRHQRSDAT
ncbi:MAG: hypothetical protein KF708_23805 [Pirellulales bacterium]|nr:hypothetical protein [Pirellulales bacterium]